MLGFFFASVGFAAVIAITLAWTKKEEDEGKEASDISIAEEASEVGSQAVQTSAVGLTFIGAGLGIANIVIVLTLGALLAFTIVALPLLFNSHAVFHAVDLVVTDNWSPFYRTFILGVADPLLSVWNTFLPVANAMNGSWRIVLSNLFTIPFECDEFSAKDVLFSLSKTFFALAESIISFLLGLFRPELDIYIPLTHVQDALLELQPLTQCYCEVVAMPMIFTLDVVGSHHLAATLDRALNLVLSFLKDTVNIAVQFAVAFGKSLIDAIGNSNVSFLDIFGEFYWDPARAPNFARTYATFGQLVARLGDWLDDILVAVVHRFFVVPKQFIPRIFAVFGQLGEAFLNEILLLSDSWGVFTPIGPLGLERGMRRLMLLGTRYDSALWNLSRPIALRTQDLMDGVMVPALNASSQIEEVFITFSLPFKDALPSNNTLWQDFEAALNFTGCTVNSTVASLMYTVETVTRMVIASFHERFSGGDWAEAVRSPPISTAIDNIIESGERAADCAADLVSILNEEAGAVIEEFVHVIIAIAEPIIELQRNWEDRSNYVRTATFRTLVDNIFFEIDAWSIALGNVFRFWALAGEPQLDPAVECARRPPHTPLNIPNYPWYVDVFCCIGDGVEEVLRLLFGFVEGVTRSAVLFVQAQDFKEGFIDSFGTGGPLDLREEFMPMLDFLVRDLGGFVCIETGAARVIAERFLNISTAMTTCNTNSQVTIWEYVVDVLTGSFRTPLHFILGGVTDIWSWIVDAVAQTSCDSNCWCTRIQNLYSDTWGVLVDWLVSGGKLASCTFNIITGSSLSGLESFLDSMEGIFGSSGSLATGDFFCAIIDFFDKVWSLFQCWADGNGFIRCIWDIVFAEFKKILVAIVDCLAGIFSAIWDYIKCVPVEIWEWIKAFFRNFGCLFNEPLKNCPKLRTFLGRCTFSIPGVCTGDSLDPGGDLGTDIGFTTGVVPNPRFRPASETMPGVKYERTYDPGITDLGSRIATVGDWDGNGIEDFVASSSSGIYGVHLVLLGRSGRVEHRVEMLRPANISLCCWAISSIQPTTTLGRLLVGDWALQEIWLLEYDLSLPFLFLSAVNASNVTRVESFNATALVPSFSALGYAVISLGDLDGDGEEDYAAGAPLYDNNRGNVFLALSNNATNDPNQTVTIVDFNITFSPVAPAASRCGWSLALLRAPQGISSDVKKVLAIGCPESNQVFLAYLTLTGELQRPIIEISENSAGALPAWLFASNNSLMRFGTSLAVVDDLDGDGDQELVISAPGLYRAGINDSGAIFIILLGSSGSVHDFVELSRESGGIFFTSAAPLFFGTAIAGVADFSGDGLPDLLASSVNLGANSSVHIMALAYPANEQLFVNRMEAVMMSGSIKRMGFQLAARLVDRNSDGRADVLMMLKTSVSNAYFVYTLQSGYAYGKVVYTNIQFDFQVGPLAYDVGHSMATFVHHNGTDVPYVAIAFQFYTTFVTPDIVEFFPITSGQIVGPSTFQLSYSSLPFNVSFGSGLGTSLDIISHPGGNVTLVMGDPAEGSVYFIHVDSSLSSVSGYSKLNGLSYMLDFGSSVAVLGDVNGDNFTDIAIGAPGNSSVVGGVQLCLLSANFTCLPKWITGWDNANPQFDGYRSPDDAFGQFVGKAGDLNNDGVPDMLVGAPRAGESSSVLFGSGTLWILYLDVNGSVIDQRAISDIDIFVDGLDVLSGDELGTAATIVPDANGDGIPEMIVSGPGRDADKGVVWNVFFSTLERPSSGTNFLNSYYLSSPLASANRLLSSKSTRHPTRRKFIRTYPSMRKRVVRPLRYKSSGNLPYRTDEGFPRYRMSHSIWRGVSAQQRHLLAVSSTTAGESLTAYTSSYYNFTSSSNSSGYIGLNISDLEEACAAELYHMNELRVLLELLVNNTNITVNSTFQERINLALLNSSTYHFSQAFEQCLFSSAMARTLEIAMGHFDSRVKLVPPRFLVQSDMFVYTALRAFTAFFTALDYHLDHTDVPPMYLDSIHFLAHTNLTDELETRFALFFERFFRGARVLAFYRRSSLIGYVVNALGSLRLPNLPYPSSYDSLVEFRRNLQGYSGDSVPLFFRSTSAMMSFFQTVGNASVLWYETVTKGQQSNFDLVVSYAQGLREYMTQRYEWHNKLDRDPLLEPYPRGRISQRLHYTHAFNSSLAHVLYPRNPASYPDLSLLSSHGGDTDLQPTCEPGLAFVPCNNRTCWRPSGVQDSLAECKTRSSLLGYATCSCRFPSYITTGVCCRPTTCTTGVVQSSCSGADESFILGQAPCSECDSRRGVCCEGFQCVKQTVDASFCPENSTFYGAGSNCSACTSPQTGRQGACCNASSCLLTTEATCVTQGGPESLWHPGQDCSATTLSSRCRSCSSPICLSCNLVVDSINDIVDFWILNLELINQSAVLGACCGENNCTQTRRNQCEPPSRFFWGERCSFCTYGLMISEAKEKALLAKYAQTSNVSFSNLTQPLPQDMLDSTVYRTAVFVLTFIPGFLPEQAFNATFQFFATTDIHDPGSWLYWARFIFVCDVFDHLFPESGPFNGIGLLPGFLWATGILFVTFAILSRCGCSFVTALLAGFVLIWLWGMLTLLLAYGYSPACYSPFFNAPKVALERLVTDEETGTAPIKAVQQIMDRITSRFGETFARIIAVTLGMLRNVLLAMFSFPLLPVHLGQDIRDQILAPLDVDCIGLCDVACPPDAWPCSFEQQPHPQQCIENITDCCDLAPCARDRVFPSCWEEPFRFRTSTRALAYFLRSQFPDLNCRLFHGNTSFATWLHRHSYFNDMLDFPGDECSDPPPAFTSPRWRFCGRLGFSLLSPWIVLLMLIYLFGWSILLLLWQVLLLIFLSLRAVIRVLFSILRSLSLPSMESSQTASLSIKATYPAVRGHIRGRHHTDKTE